MYQIIAEINTRDKLKLVELANQIDGYHGVGEESKNPLDSSMPDTD